MRVRACGEPTDRNFAPHGSAPPLMNQRVPPYSGCMSSLPFDTHRAVKALCEAGAPEPLTEAFVETIADAKTDLEAGVAAIKADIRKSETALHAEISETEATLRAEVAEVRTGVANVRAELKTDIGLVRADVGAVQGEIGGLEARLYRQL